MKRFSISFHKQLIKKTKRKNSDIPFGFMIYVIKIYIKNLLFWKDYFTDVYGFLCHLGAIYSRGEMRRKIVLINTKT